MATLYPTIHGFRVNPGVELSDGWNERELRDVMYALRANPDDDALLLESCTGREADSLLNPGAAMVLEAVTAQYNKLGRTMAALARVLGRHLPESLTLEGEPYIGPDRKNALFAYKVVTFNVSDGQTVSVLFHSPDNDPKKFQPDETLIAYRWMLNKLDITASVAPENGRDITLELMAKRMAQLIEANSAKFQEQNAAREERTAALADAEARREELRARTETAADEITALEDDLQSLASRASKTAERLEAERARNERLKAAKAAKPEPVEPVEPVQPGQDATQYTLKFRNKSLVVLDRDGNEAPDYEGFADMLGSKHVTFISDGRRHQSDVLLLSDSARSDAVKAIQEAKSLLVMEGDLLESFRRSKDKSGVDYVIRDSSPNSNSVKIKPSGFGAVFSDQDIKALREWLEPFGFSVLATTDSKGVLSVIARDRAFAEAFANHGTASAGVKPELVKPAQPAQPSLETDLSTYRDLVKAGDADAAEELATQAPGRHGISYRDFIEKAGVSHETFATTPYADPRTRYAAALAEELAMAGFTPYDFPTGQPDFELGQYTAIASMQMAAGSGSVYVNEVAAGKATVEANYNPEMQPGLPLQASSSQTFTFDVPVGVLEGKFDDVVGEISGWLAQFGTAFDGVKLPEFGEKLKTDGVNQHDAADIAKRIRQDIKAMLPPGFKPSMFTVRSSKYSMGQSIKIGVKEVPEGFRLYETEAIEDQYGDKRYPMTRDAVALLKALKAIGNAYRYDNSDSQSDYFDTNFYFDAGYDDDLLRQQREMAENAKAEAAKAANDAKIAEMRELPIEKRTDTIYPLNGTDEFKAFLAKETESSIHGESYSLDQSYSPFATAVDADRAAKKRGLKIHWDMNAQGFAVGMIEQDGIIAARIEMASDGKALEYFGASGDSRPKLQYQSFDGTTKTITAGSFSAGEAEEAMASLFDNPINGKALKAAIKKGVKAEAAGVEPEPTEPQPEPAEPMTVEQARKALEDAQKRAREYRNTNNEGGYGFNPYDAEVEQAMQSLQDARNRELLADAEGYRARWNSAVQRYAKNGQLATGDLKKVEQEAGMTANEAKWLKEHATQPQQPAPQPATPEPSGNTPNPEEQTVTEVEAINPAGDDYTDIGDYPSDTKVMRDARIAELSKVVTDDDGKTMTVKRLIEKKIDAGWKPVRQESGKSQWGRKVVKYYLENDGSQVSIEGPSFDYANYYLEKSKNRPASAAVKAGGEVEAIAAELQKLADGAVTDTGEFDQMLDELADRAEKAGAMEELDGLLNAAADKLTELLEKEAASVA